MTSRISSSEYPSVVVGLEKVDREVRPDVEYCAHDRHPEDQGEVDGPDSSRGDPRPRGYPYDEAKPWGEDEDVLHVEDADRGGRKDYPHYHEYRGERVSQREPVVDFPLRDSVGPGRPDVILAQDSLNGGTCVPRDVPEWKECERQHGENHTSSHGEEARDVSGQDCVKEVRAGNRPYRMQIGVQQRPPVRREGKDAETDGEDELEEQTQPELRERDERNREDPQQRIRLFARAPRRLHTNRNPQSHCHESRERRQRQGVGERLKNKGQDRLEGEGG